MIGNMKTDTFFGHLCPSIRDLVGSNAGYLRHYGDSGYRSWIIWITRSIPVQIWWRWVDSLQFYSTKHDYIHAVGGPAIASKAVNSRWYPRSNGHIQCASVYYLAEQQNKTCWSRLDINFAGSRQHALDNGSVLNRFTMQCTTEPVLALKMF
jgi:hypothetical protein